MNATDILVNDHAEVDALLRGLWDAFEGGEAEEVLAKLDYLWARLAVHIRAEHLHLFPALLAAAASGPGLWARRARWPPRACLRTGRGCGRLRRELRQWPRGSRNTTVWRKSRYTSGPLRCSARRR